MQQPQPKKEHPSTYFVQDRSNLDERMRVMIQDQMLTSGMGGVLPEQDDPASFQRILDVGCGTGKWLIETAKTYPTISQLVGIDISARMVDFARERAKAEGVSDRVEFQVMDALRMIEFPQDYFDLVNQRFGMSYIRTWDWPKILKEYLGIVRSGGVIRITESDITLVEQAPAFASLTRIVLDTWYQAGYLFDKDGQSVTRELPKLFQRYGLKDIQLQDHHMEYRAGTEPWQYYYEDMKLVYQTGVPFFRKWTKLPENYDELYAQAMEEIQQPDFAATWDVRTVWGHKRA